MIRSIFVGTAGALLLAATVAAQTRSAPLGRFALELQTIPPPPAERAGTDSAEPGDQQPANSFEELGRRVAGGDTVYVVDASGRETRGRVATLSEAALTLVIDGTRREFAADAVKRIDRRRRDPVRNGLLIGAGTGALVGYGFGRSADSPTCPRSGIECGQGAVIGVVSGALWGAVGGWITDALIRKRETIYLPDGPGR